MVHPDVKKYEELPSLLKAENPEARLGAAIALSSSVDSLPFNVSLAAIPPLAEIIANRSGELPHTRAQALRCLVNLCGATAENPPENVRAYLAALEPLLEPLLASLVADLRAGVLGEHTCAWVGCSNAVTAANMSFKEAKPHPKQSSDMKRCSQCKVMWYCGPQCSKLHWNAGHKTLCKFIASKRASLNASVPNASEADLAFLASAFLANSTRDSVFVCGAQSERPLASFVGLCADIAARCPLPAAERTAATLLDVVNNLTQSSLCRLALTDSSSGEQPIRRLVDKFYQSSRESFALPVATLLRNLCLDKALHEKLIPTEGSSSTLDIPALLLSKIRGEAVLSEGEMKGMPKLLHKPRKLESNTRIRTAAVEALLCLACNRIARVDLIKRRAYPIFREYDLVEKDEKIKEMVNQIVDLLARDSKGDESCAVAEPLEQQAPVPIDTSAVKDDHEVTKEEMMNKGVHTRGEIEKMPVPAAMHISSKKHDTDHDDDEDDDEIDDSFVEEI